jgi:hypothetical protein
MAITESLITLNFPDNNFFRFQDCQGYKDIQNHFKEMDACWYEQATDTLYLIELKNWGNNILDEESDPSVSAEDIAKMKKGITEHRIKELFKKSMDSVCMYMSILLNKPYSSNIQACSPFTITETTQIKLLSIINWTNVDTTYISAIKSEYQSRFKSYAKLFNIKTFVVMTKAQASQRYDWIT